MQDSPKPGAQLTSESPLPRLKIIHLLLWTACAGALLAFSELWIQLGGINEEILREYRLRATSFTVFFGLAVAGTITLFVQVARGSQTAFRYTGHWLLCYGALHAVGSNTATIATHFAKERRLPGSEYFRELSFAAILAGGSTLLVVGLILTKPSRPWKVYLLYAAACQFASAGAHTVLPFVWDFSRLLSFLSAIRLASTLCAVLLLLIGIREWRRGLRRDWLHWAGIVSVLGGVAANWLVQFLQPLLLN